MKRMHVWQSGLMVYRHVRERLQAGAGGSTRSAVGLEIQSVAAHLRNCGALFGDAGDVLAFVEASWDEQAGRVLGGCKEGWIR